MTSSAISPKTVSHRSAAVAALAQKFKAMTQAQRISTLRAEGVISQREQRQLTVALPPKPVEPTRIQPEQAAMRYLNLFVTSDPDLLKVKEQVKILATKHWPVLILGESGTGKELIARALHGNRTGAFKAINCAAISENLIESELFGHVKGSFTGAYTDRMGILQSAANGTAFLDEIGDLSYPLQAKLLRTLQNKTIRRVGSNDDEPIDCRVVAATRIDIKDKLDNGFRLDLYYRLSTFELQLKPLRDLAIEHFTTLAQHFGATEEDVDCLFPQRNSLHGNVRNLEQYFIRKKVLGELV